MPYRYLDGMEREGPQQRIRVGNDQREAAIRALGQHMSTGHLDTAEYSERVDRALAARTVGEIDALFADLPGPHQQPPNIRPTPAMPQHPPPSSTPGTAGAEYAPYGRDAFGRPLSDKSRVVAGLLQLLLPIGIGRFYMGDIGTGVAQLLLTLLCGVGAIWAFIDGIVILAAGATDPRGRRLRP